MYSRILSQGVRKARKKHHDDSHEDIIEWVKGGFYVEKGVQVLEEDKKIATIISNMPSVIQPGEYHFYQTQASEEGIFTFRTRIPTRNLDQKYNFIYTDD